MTNIEEIWTTGFIIDKVESGSSSLRVLFLSADRNLIWLTAKGARTTKTILGNQLQSFSLLSLKLGGNKYNYINDVKAESLPLTYSGVTGFCSHYLNELIKYLLVPNHNLGQLEDHEAAWELFCLYKEALLALFQASNNLQQQLTLRAFEVKLLHYAATQGLLDFNFNLAEFEDSSPSQLHGFIPEYGFTPLDSLHQHTDIAPQIKEYLLQGLNAQQIEQELKLKQKLLAPTKQSPYDQEIYSGDPLALEFLERSFQIVKTYFQHSFPAEFFRQAKIIYLEPEARFQVTETQLAKLKLEAKKLIERKLQAVPNKARAMSSAEQVKSQSYLDNSEPSQESLRELKRSSSELEDLKAANLVKQAKLAKLESEAELILYQITQELAQDQQSTDYEEGKISNCEPLETESNVTTEKPELLDEIVESDDIPEILAELLLAQEKPLAEPTLTAELEDPKIAEALRTLDDILATNNISKQEPRDTNSAQLKLTDLLETSPTPRLEKEKPAAAENIDVFEYLDIDADKLHQVLAEFAVVISDQELVKSQDSANSLSSKNSTKLTSVPAQSNLLKSETQKLGKEKTSKTKQRRELKKTQVKDWEYETLILEQNLLNFANKFNNYGYLEQIPNLPLFMNQSKQFTQFLLNLALGNRELHSRKLMQEFLALSKEFS